MVWGKCQMVWGKFVKWCGGKWCGGGFFENSNGVREQKKHCGVFFSKRCVGRGVVYFSPRFIL